METKKGKLLTQWLYNKINDRELKDYFERHPEIKDIVIYGIGELGEFFYDDVTRHTKITVRYIIDRNADSLYYGIEGIDIVTLAEASNKEVPDTVVVTVLSNTDTVKQDLKHIFGNIRILLLEDIIYEVE